MFTVGIGKRLPIKDKTLQLVDNKKVYVCVCVCGVGKNRV